ncbi:radical SAM protein [Candidatus Bipolaricaulota bacterium]|nr:radical SAM protein [Candidatus Bipolaricaulota bacterium]
MGRFRRGLRADPRLSRRPPHRGSGPRPGYRIKKEGHLKTEGHVFGPVPSRRLGRSLGINNIPPKICSYSCVYCQLGRTLRMEAERRAFYEPEEIVRAVRARAGELRDRGEKVDHLTFVPDGEPTLDANLGREIAALKDFGIPIAVISNASLIFREEVREELSRADWVSLKVDAAREATWERTNRPHKALFLEEIRKGILEFASEFSGTLATETMLVSGLNDAPEELSDVAEFLSQVKPDIAYISIPTRPPAEPWVKSPSEKALTMAYAIFSERLPRVELLIGYEGDEFAATGDAVTDILSITAVHPMREDVLKRLLARDGADWSIVARLLGDGKLVELQYRGHRFYLRRLPSPRG